MPSEYMEAQAAAVHGQKRLVVERWEAANHGGGGLAAAAAAAAAAAPSAAGAAATAAGAGLPAGMSAAAVAKLAEIRAAVRRFQAAAVPTDGSRRRGQLRELVAKRTAVRVCVCRRCSASG